MDKNILLSHVLHIFAVMRTYSIDKIRFFCYLHYVMCSLIKSLSSFPLGSGHVIGFYSSHYFLA
jgi:hypothetical protein